MFHSLIPAARNFVASQGFRAAKFAIAFDPFWRSMKA
jgi:hypothetical protein